jgi:hypothetical protein
MEGKLLTREQVGRIQVRQAWKLGFRCIRSFVFKPNWWCLEHPDVKNLRSARDSAYTGANTPRRSKAWLVC